MLQIPFFENSGDGNQCLQVAMKSVIKYFLDKDISLSELDKMTERKEGKWTWTSQIVTVLYDLGLDVMYYSKGELESFVGGEPYIRKVFGEKAEIMIKNSDIPVMIDSIKKVMKYKLFQRKNMTFKEIEEHIIKGHVPMLMIDHNILAGKGGEYQGHFVIVTGFDKENVYYHESGPKNPKPNKKVSKKKFIDAWNALGTDNDTVIVFGKRFKL